MSDDKMPSDATFRHASKIAVKCEKPIMLDYWLKSLGNSVVIGIRGTGEKLLVKNEEEYTSPIAKIYKVENEYIIETENSLYVVVATIATKRIS
jgi:hypothetical protein